jgi:very-short-patch-repair endonuclease
MRRPRELKQRSRELRKESTPAESILWKHLRSRRFASFKFRRQYIVGPFIADFYCASRALVIELDGETHLGRGDDDQSRQAYLERQGLKVLRFWNNMIYDELDSVLECIYRECITNSKPM